MSDHKLYSSAETQNAKNIIALAKLLCQKGVLSKDELARIFSSEFETESYVSCGRFPLNLLPETAGFVDDSLKIIEVNKQKIYDFMKQNAIQGQIIAAVSRINFCRYEIRIEPETEAWIFSLYQDDIRRLMNVNSVVVFYPKKNHVCIDVPHLSKTSVSIRQLLESEEWKNFEAKIPLAVGKNVSGEPIILDLDQIRNLLIIGTVENGKGTLLNSIVLSLLHRFSPNELQLVMYAPEQAISGICRTLPHLSQPQMACPKEVYETFERLLEEIRHRRRIIADAGTDNFTKYNAFVSDHDKIPRIVVIIDNFTDLKWRDKMDYRLIQIILEGYEVGIHLILVTRRSDSEVTPVIGLFPALIQFFPTRIRHLYAGDMQVRTSKNKRLGYVHAALTANCDISKVVEFISEQART